MTPKIYAENPINHPLSRRSFARLLGGAGLGLAGAGKLLAVPATAEPFTNDFGVCTSYAKFPFLKGLGYSYIEEKTRDLLQPHKSEEQLADSLAEVRDEGIRIHACSNFLPGSLKSTGPNADHEAVLNYSDIVFRRAKMFGVNAIVFGSSGSRKLPEGFDRSEGEKQFVALLKKMAPLAGSYGVEVWVEPLNRNEDNFINTQLEGAAIVEKVGHPSIGMVCDIFHIARNGESPDDIKKCIGHIRHCHVAEKANRTPPGIEKFDFTPYLGALKTGGYDKSISMECHWKNIEEQAATALDYLSTQMEGLP